MKTSQVKGADGRSGKPGVQDVPIAALREQHLMENPLVTIVTPSLNASRFIESTIESVLQQDYPNLEYLVFDAGSTDGTTEIVRRHGKLLTLVVEPDQGTADAINKGFRRGTGTICAWLAADDIYLPGAIRAGVDALQNHPEAAVAYGQADWIDENGLIIDHYPTPEHLVVDDLARECVLSQPACFMRRAALEEVGFLDPSLKSAFDYDLWIRLVKKYPFVPVKRPLAQARMHPANKSLGQKALMFEESMALLRRHFGYVPSAWMYCYVSFLNDHRDQFFSPLQHSSGNYLAAFAAGLRSNRGQKARFLTEWLMTMTPMRHLLRRRR